jgi:signal transduction histidine kinase
MLAAGFASSLDGFAQLYALYGMVIAPEAGLPLRNTAAWLQNLWVINLSLLFIYLPLFFPNGELPSRRWRPLVRFMTVYLSLFVLVLAVADLPLTGIFLDTEVAVQNPYGLIRLDFIPENIGQVLFIANGILFAACLLVALASLFFRWRDAGSQVRLQMKWLLYFLGLLVALRLADWIVGAVMEINPDGPDPVVYLRYAQQLAGVGLVAALGIAVLRYRLYDIDLIINRTAVYGALTAIIAAGYVLMVTALGDVLPVEGNLLPSLITTGVIAGLFAPLRDWLQRGVNRLMFGKRDDPYQLLSQLGRSLSRAGPPDQTLEAVVETVASSLKLPYVAIQLEQPGGDQRKVVSHGDPDYLTRAGQRTELHLSHQNERVGQLLVAPRSPGESLSTRDQQLLRDIAHQVGAVAHAVRLKLALQKSHQQLLMAREEERRRLRRDLHDGLGPTLASHTLALDTAMDLIRDDPEAALDQLQHLHQQTQELVADIRRLVHQLRPPVLDDLGLLGALQAHIRRNQRRDQPPHFTLQASPEKLPPMPAAVELAAYRITMEAVTNVIRHAKASRCRVDLALQKQQDRLLGIKVVDDGRGLPPDLSFGLGILSMRQRAEELGGTFDITKSALGGTQVVAELPVLREEGA